MTVVGKVTNGGAYVMQQLANKDQTPIRMFISVGAKKSGLRFFPSTGAAASVVRVSDDGDAFVRVFKDTLTSRERERFDAIVAPFKKLIKESGLGEYSETESSIVLGLSQEMLQAKETPLAKKGLSLLFRAHGVLPPGWEGSRTSSYSEPAIELLEKTMREDFQSGKLAKFPINYYVDFSKNVIVREK